MRFRWMRNARSRAHAAIALVALLPLLAGCFAAPMPPLAGAHPAEPDVKVPAVPYSSVLGRYVSRRPVEPAPWREQNERVAPSANQ